MSVGPLHEPCSVFHEKVVEEDVEWHFETLLQEVADGIQAEEEARVKYEKEQKEEGKTDAHAVLSVRRLLCDCA